VAAGYGITPYGIGDWGSENSFVPGVGALSIQSQPPIVQTGIIPSGGAVLIGSAPVVIVVIERVKTPGTGVLGFVGKLPLFLPQLSSGTTYTPGTGSINVQGHAPSLVREKVVTPTGGAVLIGSAPVVIVKESVKTPGVGAVNILGRVPAVAQSKVITPAAGQLNLVGSAPVLKNPNWVNIDDSQTANWVAVAA
jgi:hypothetical protein